MTTLVIGGGLMGVTTAWALQSRGESVHLLDALDGVALETSFANAGLITPSMPEPWNGPGVFGHLAASLFDPRSSMRLRPKAIPSLVGWGVKFLQHSSPAHHFAACTDNYHLARYSLEQTARVTEELGLEYDRGTAGTLSVFRDEASFKAKEAVCRHVAELGMTYRKLTPAEVVDLEPTLASIADKIVCGVHYPEDDHGDAHKFCRALAGQFRAGGGVTTFGVEADAIVLEGRRVRGISTSQGDIDADRVVVAAGTRSPRLLATVGVGLPVKPVKGYSVTVDIDDPEALPGLPVIDDSMHACLTPLGNRLRMVGTAEFTGFDKRIDPLRTDNLIRLFRELLPELAARTPMDKALRWAGLRPMTYDGRPFIGGTGIDGLYVNAGHGPLGWTMAMGSAAMLADQLTRRTPAIDPTPYALSRICN